MTAMIPVAILNWNGERDTLECVRSLRRSQPAGFLPVVVDNGSDPASVTRLKQDCAAVYPRVLSLGAHELASLAAEPGRLAPYRNDDSLVFIESPENLGFARGSNLGVRLAEATGSDWVLLLNNDTVVRPDTLLQLRRFAEAHPEFAALTAQVQFFEPETRIQNCGGELTYFGSRRYHLANVDTGAAPRREYSVVTFVTGCALLYNYRAVGALTEDFFFGEEDYEFSLRLRRLGRPMACVHAAVVHHKVGASIRKSSRPLGGILANYVTRLLNVRNYYSRTRWHATRILAYLYLPLLLARNGVDPRKSLAAIRRVEDFIAKHQAVGRADFQSLVASEW